MFILVFVSTAISCLAQKNYPLLQLELENPNNRIIDSIQIRNHPLLPSSTDKRFLLKKHKRIHFELVNETIIYLEGGITEKLFLEVNNKSKITFLTNKQGFDSLVFSNDLLYKKRLIQYLEFIEIDHWKEVREAGRYEGNTDFLNATEDLYIKQTNHVLEQNMSDAFREYLTLYITAIKIEYLLKKPTLSTTNEYQECIRAFDELVNRRPKLFLQDKRICKLAYHLLLNHIETKIDRPYEHFWYNDIDEIVKILNGLNNRALFNEESQEMIYPNIIFDVLYKSSIDHAFRLFENYRNSFPRSSSIDFLSRELESYSELRQGGKMPMPNLGA